MARYQRKQKTPKKRAPGGSQAKLRPYKCQKVAKWSRNGYLNFLQGYKMRHCGYLSSRDMVKYGAKEWNTLTPDKKAFYKIKPGSQEYKRIMAKRMRNKKNRRPTEAVAPIQDVMEQCNCLQDNAEIPTPEIQTPEVAEWVVVHLFREPPAGGAAASGESPEPPLPPAGGVDSSCHGIQKDEAGP